MELSKEERKIVLSGRENYEVWKFQYNIAVSNQKESAKMRYIAFSVTENVLRRLTTCRSSAEMLEKLEELYGTDVSVNKLYLQNKFYSLKCTGNVIEFIDDIDSLLSKLIETGENISDEMVVSKVLCTLPNSYQTFVTAFECGSDTSFKSLRTKLNTEYERRKFFSKKIQQNDEGASNDIKNLGVGEKSFFSQQNVTCNYCKKDGHFLKDCLVLKNKSKTTHCYKCGQVGHIAKYCKDQEADGTLKLAATVLVAGKVENGLESCFVIDSGASQHMSSNKSLFDFIESSDEHSGIVMPDGEVLQCCGSGQITLKSKGVKIELSNVLYVPKLNFNLIAARNFIKNGIDVCLKPDCWEMRRNGVLLLTGHVKFSLYVLEFLEPEVLHSETVEDIAKANLTLKEWHIRCGHQNLTYVKDLLKNKNINYKNEKVECESCKLGKMNRKPFHASEYVAKERGELVHMDVGGPMEVNSLGNNRFYFLLRDDYSNWRTVFFMKAKSEVKIHLANYLSWFKTQTGNQVKKLRSDNGVEEVNRDIESILENLGIMHEKTCPYTPEQNGRAERDNRTIVECARTMMLQRNMEKKFWAEATNAAVFILNRTGRTKVPKKTPIELFMNKTPDIDFLKPYGAKVFVHVPKEKRKKWDPKAREGLFVGYDDEVKGYRIYFKDKKSIETHRDVDFIEDHALIQIPAADEPQSYEEIQFRNDFSEWNSAIEKELNAMFENNVWEEVSNPDCRLLDTKWVFKIKADGSYKARLVVRGCFQNFPEDSNLYAPVAKLNTVRILISVAVKNNLKIHHLDVNTAFLNGVLEEEVYIKPPPGVIVKSGNVLKLKKSMYGLRQSPKCWFKCLHSVLVESGFRKSEFDECLYIKGHIYCIVYVDDILLIGPDVDNINNEKCTLADKFSVKDLGQIKKCLGMNITITDGVLKLDQIGHIEKAIKSFGLDNCRTEKTPMEKDFYVSNESNDNDKTVKPYRQLLGTLSYIMSCSRPDTSYSVNILSRFQESATDTHYKYLLRVLKYLHSSKDIKLNFSNLCEEPTECFVDASWADKGDRKSTSGFFIKVFGNIVIWKTKKQTTIALSSAEAEYVALCEAARELVWVKGILSDLGISVGTVKIYEDNSSCISMTKIDSLSKRSKHIDVKLHFVRQLVENGTLELVKVNSEDQCADGLTKSLVGEKFNKFVISLNLA